jgi:hypothetical protein
VSRRRSRTATRGGSVRDEYAAQLRRQWEGGPAWSHFRLVVERLEQGESVVVPSWAVRKWTGFPAAAFGGPERVELCPDGSVVPVVPAVRR